MPMYEYQCAACGHSDTLLEKVGSSSTKKCPECGKLRAFKRQLSAPSFHLKGTGWYATDFRDNGKKKESDSKTDDAKPEPAKDGDKKADKAESKPKAEKKAEKSKAAAEA